MSRGFGSLTASFALLLAVLSVPAAAQVQAAEEQTMTANDGTVYIVKRSTVRVPERRVGGNSARYIDLAVVQVRIGGEPGTRAHAILAGGPGASGVDEVLSLARNGGAAWFELMGGDVVGIDQRGTGASRPSLASTARYALPLDRPGSPELWLPLIEAASRKEAERLRAEGVDLQAYNTEESADDVDAVRRALGYGKMILWGRSYGSHLALAVMRRHPDAVERAVLVSPEGSDHTWKSPAETDKVLERMAERAKAPELLTDMRTVLDRLSREPVSVAVVDPESQAPHRVTLGSFDVQLAVAQALGSPQGLAGLPAAFRAMAADDFSTVARLTYLYRSRGGIQSAMKQAMDLASDGSDSRKARISSEARTALLGNAMNFPTMELARAWDVDPLPPGFRTPVQSSAPVIILAGDLDARTPLRNAEEIATGLTNARLIRLENAAHEFSLFGNKRLRDLLGQFLEGQPVADEAVVLPPLAFVR